MQFYLKPTGPNFLHSLNHRPVYWSSYGLINVDINIMFFVKGDSNSVVFQNCMRSLSSVPRVIRTSEVQQATAPFLQFYTQTSLYCNARLNNNMETAPDMLTITGYFL